MRREESEQEERSKNTAPSTVTREVDLIPDRDDNTNTEMYDMVPLPSKGECYKSKISKVPVAYLTAYDENMIVSPNLYRDNMIIDTMLKHKILKSFFL